MIWAIIDAIFTVAEVIARAVIIAAYAVSLLVVVTGCLK